MTVLRHVGRLWTAAEPVREDVDVVLQDGLISSVAPGGSARPEEVEVDCRRRLLTPGLIDAHTHPLYLRPRLAEVAERSMGVGYTQVAERGGGILATVRETTGAGEAELAAATRRRLRAWLEQGTTTVEAKTGYLLDPVREVESVAMLRRLAHDPYLPSLAVTFLAAHQLPRDGGQDRAGFVREVAAASPAARAAGASFCDVFCDAGAFTVDESEKILRAGRSAGLALRLHADELQLTGGATLAARLGARSADHLLRITETEVRLLAAAGTVATLCPVTALAMGQLPPARALLDGGATLALGSDHNPGTSGTTSMALVVYLAAATLHLSVQEALTAATMGGASSLGLADRGRIYEGAVADVVLWDEEHEGALAWRPGLLPAQVWHRGIAQL